MLSMLFHIWLGVGHRKIRQKMESVRPMFLFMDHGKMTAWDDDLSEDNRNCAQKIPIIISSYDEYVLFWCNSVNLLEPLQLKHFVELLQCIPFWQHHLYAEHLSSTSRLEEYQTASHLKGISDILRDERQMTDVLHKVNVVRRGCTAVNPQKIIVRFSFASMVNNKWFCLYYWGLSCHAFTSCLLQFHDSWWGIREWEGPCGPSLV